MSQPTDPFGMPPQPKPGMSTGGKVLLGLGLGCGVVLLLCCGVFGVAGYFFSREFQVIQDPDKVLAVAAGIASVDLPKSLEPKYALDPVVPIVNAKTGSTAMFVDAANTSFLMMSQAGQDDPSPLSATIQFEAIMEAQGHKVVTDAVPVTESETVAVDINGEAAEFEVGKGQTNNREVWQASGDFHGKGGAAVLLLQLDAAEFSKDDAIGVVKSIK